MQKQWITLQVGGGLSPEIRRLIILVAVFSALLLLALAGTSYMLKRRLNEKVANLKNAQQKVFDQSELLQFAAENAQAGIWDHHLVRGKIYLDWHWFGMLGYPREGREITENEFRNYIHPEDLPAMEQSFRNCTASWRAGRFEAEFRLRQADGNWCWILSKGKAVEYDEKGKPARVIGLDLNIQSIKETQDRIAQSEARFRAIFDYAPFAIVINSLNDGRYLEANRTFLKKLGINKEKLLGMHFNDFALVTDEELKAVLGELQEHGAVENVEATVRNSDGILSDVIYSSVLLEIEGQKQILSITIDVTERKRAEDALRASEEKFSKVFMMTPDLIAITRIEDGLIADVNISFEEFTGWKRSEVIGKKSSDLDFWVDPSSRESMVTELKNGRDVLHREMEYRCKDGTVRTGIYSARMISILDDSYLVYVMQDVTDSRRLEAKHRKLERQLAQARKLEAIGNLAGGVAHDFNNMLGAIMGYAEMGMDRISAEDPVRNYFNQILDVARRSANLTRQLLAFARRQAMSPVRFDLNTSIEGTLKLLRWLIGENIDLIWLPTREPCAVDMDPSHLDQILANLCVNARDAIADIGRIVIKSEVVSFDESASSAFVDSIPGDYVLLSVSDNGRGMDQETQGYVFEPFFTTKAVGQGTGLGLSTIYGIVKQNNGFIGLCSEPGMGTTFYIYLPRQDIGEVVETTAADAEIPRSRGETVLLVEDNPILLEMGLLMLHRLDYNVLPAATPVEALRLAQENDTEIQLLITDVVMPEMNGRELADRLLEIRPRIKQIFMSGYTSDIVIKRGVWDEGINFIRKPFSLKDLAFKIRAVLDH